MKKRIPLLMLISLASLLLLSGCVNVIQEITIREDGSGSLRIALGVEAESYEYALEMIPDGYEVSNILSTLTLDDYALEVTEDHYEEGGSIWDSVEVEFSDMMAVFGEGRTFGPVTIELTEENGEYSFVEEIDVYSSTLTISGVHLMDVESAGYNVRLTAPQIVRTSGLQEAAGVSTWEVSVFDLIEEEDLITLTADYKLEPYEGNYFAWEKWYPYIVIGFIGTGALAILVIVVVNTTNIGKRDKDKLNIH